MSQYKICIVTVAGHASAQGAQAAWVLGARRAAWAPGLARTVHSVHPT